MIRRLFSFVMLALLLLCRGSSSAENSITHYIPEKEVSVTVPFDILCVTREADETNTFFQNEYFDYATVHDYMLNNDMYLYGMTSNYQGEFVLSITDYFGLDINSASEGELSSYESVLKNTLGYPGVKDIKSEIYRESKNKAIHLSYIYETSQGNQYGSIYFTTHASNLYMFRFISFFNPISASQEKAFQSVFDSIEWGKKDYTPGPKGDTDINIYTDNETGLSFMVPSGWSEVKFIAGEASKKVKYRIGAENVWVLYESGDLWDVIQQNYGSLISTYGVTRADCDNTFLSEEMISQMLGCTSSDKITKKTVGSQEYFCVDKTTDYSSGELSITNHDLVYICMRNGYLYWFQLSGTDISRFEDQFIRFMKTIEFP